MVRAIINNNSSFDVNLGSNPFSGLIRDLLIDRVMKGLPSRLVDTDRESNVSVEVVIPAGAFIVFSSDVDEEGADVVKEKGLTGEAIEEWSTKLQRMAEEDGRIICLGLAQVVTGQTEPR